MQRGNKGNEISITVLYDNNQYNNELISGWGFSCIIQFPDRSVLFDTGADGLALLHNMSKLGIASETIDSIVLSHIHYDHTSGLAHILGQNNIAKIFMPVSFPNEIKQEVIISGAKLYEVQDSMEIFKDMFTTGELEGPVNEQSFFIRTKKGLLVITGCAHPGIINIVKHIREMNREKIYLLIGGFHLLRAVPSQTRYVAENLLKLGVERVAPCHCSGEVTKQILRQYYGNNYIDCGVGSKIQI